MKEHPNTSPRVRMRTYLAAWYALFIVYGSLSPFSGWQDQGLNFFAVLTAPLSQTYSGFDTVINLLAYIPFGFLLGIIATLAFRHGLGLVARHLGRDSALRHDGIYPDVFAQPGQFQSRPAYQ